jgi:hypothetical protein
VRLEDVPKPLARDLLGDLVSNGQPPSQFTRLLTVGYERFLNTVETELLEGLLPAGFGSVRVIVARNGNGKTHLCQDIVERAVERDYAVAEVDLTRERELSSPSALYSIVASRVRIPSDGGPVRGIDRILRDFSDPRAISDEARMSGPYREAAYRLVESDQIGDDLDLLGQWLRGEALSTTDRRRFRLKARLSDRNAMQWMRNLALVCRAVGATGLVVVLDEAEATTSDALKRLQTRLSVMLDILNSVTSGGMPHTLFLFTGVSGSFDDRWEALKPVRQRMWPNLPFQKDNRNPRSIRVDADGTGGVPESEWLERVAGKIGKLAEKAGRSSTRQRHSEIQEVIEDTQQSPRALNKRTFIREVAEIVARR